MPSYRLNPAQDHRCGIVASNLGEGRPERGCAPGAKRPLYVREVGGGRFMR